MTTIMHPDDAECMLDEPKHFSFLKNPLFKNQPLYPLLPKGANSAMPILKLHLEPVLIKLYPKHAPFLRHAFEAHRATHHLGVALHDVEAEACALRRVHCVAGPEEAVEQVFLLCFRDAYTPIADADAGRFFADINVYHNLSALR